MHRQQCNIGADTLSRLAQDSCQLPRALIVGETNSIFRKAIEIFRRIGPQQSCNQRTAAPGRGPRAAAAPAPDRNAIEGSQAKESEDAAPNLVASSQLSLVADKSRSRQA